MFPLSIMKRFPSVTDPFGPNQLNVTSVGTFIDKVIATKQRNVTVPLTKLQSFKLLLETTLALISGSGTVY